MTAPRLLTVKEVAEMLRVSPNILYTWRAAGMAGETDPGPASFKVGGKVAYLESTVTAWLEAQIAETSSQRKAS